MQNATVLRFFDFISQWALEEACDGGERHTAVVVEQAEAGRRLTPAEPWFLIETGADFAAFPPPTVPAGEFIRSSPPRLRMNIGHILLPIITCGAVRATLIWMTALLVTWEGQARGQESTRRAVNFQRQIQPIFAKRCFACHGPDKNEGGLRLHDHEAAIAELDSGEHAIVPGDLEKSAILLRIATDDESMRMPPEGKPLTVEEVSLIRQWIAEGANWAKHWAFVPRQAQTPPEVKDAAWVVNPIDAFILRGLEEAGLSPAPPAGKAALLRRAYFDLTGLPPTPEEVDAFLADDSPSAYEAVIDRLLESPRYGERWARHWLDVVRFAETNSFERDGVKPNAWRYRDYVIRSFNDDKPYDRFLLEQLAGDELPDRSPETIIATGYYRLGLWDDEPADPELARFDEFDDILTTTSHGMLGLTVDCARCHDHKIDPILQTDYYRMVAFFADLRPYGTRGDQSSWNQTDISPPDVAAKHEALDGRLEELRERMTQIEERGIVKMPAEDQRKTEGSERRKVLREKLRDYLSTEDWEQYAALREQYYDLDREKDRLPPRESALSVNGCLRSPPEIHVLQRGNPHVEGPVVTPGYPSIAGGGEPAIPAPAENAESSGRRLALAKWITSPDNLLSARVMANRIWQHHFGRGIVRSPNNFGLGGEPPTHPELLDWLADDFVQGGWRMKRLHKRIMLSSAYRMSSQGSPEGLAKDPNNDLFWRFNIRRLSAEEIRDSIHAVTGQLNLKMYGPGMYPELSQEVLRGQSMPGSGWGDSSPEEQARRSIYIHVKRSLIPPSLANFDFPETDRTCEARFITTQPTQALNMLNGDFVHQQAAALAERLREDAPRGRESQIQRALRLALGRPVTAADVQRGVKLIEKLKAAESVADDKALELFCLYVLNLNEFVYLD